MKSYIIWPEVTHT